MDSLNLSLLSKPAILKHLEAGTIVIDPFDPENLGSCGYDVTLGKWYFKEQPPEGGFTIYNLYSEKDVRRIWGEPQQAESAWQRMRKHGIQELYGVDVYDKIIWLGPGETILAHTAEFIGGRRKVTTMMKARSSVGRNFLEVCKCAGWGDVDYFNRWTMEFTNNSGNFYIPLVVGRRYAQIIFFEVEEVNEGYVEQTGKYQNSFDLKELKANWSPEMMLPKLYQDREAQAARAMMSQRVEKELTAVLRIHENSGVNLLMPERNRAVSPPKSTFPFELPDEEE